MEVDGGMRMLTELFSELCDPWPDACFLLTPAGVLAAANQAGARMLGGTRHKLPGRSITDFVITPAEKVLRHLAISSRNSQQIPGLLSCHGKDGQEVKYRSYGQRIQRKADAAPLVFLRCSPFHSAISKFIALNRQFEKLQEIQRQLLEERNQLKIEMAERKVADEEIKRLNTDLEQRVVERTTQLEAANQELEAFCYSVSHDLRAPLRHIDGYVDLMVSRCRADLSDKGLHYLDTIAASARQMGVLIDDLLQFSRTGRAEMLQKNISMNQALQEALTPLKIHLAGRTIEWVIGDLPSVRGDYALLRQVWANLLDNAVKYTRTRDVARIEVSASEANGHIIFVVADNGVGFDMQYAGKLFGVFQRLHALEEFEGTGIGLATVHRIITRHGGRVWAEAELSRGARFYFTLPK